MIRERFLAPEEWPRLDTPGLLQAHPYVDPRDAAIAVVEDDGRIVACMTVAKLTHFESVWIHPERRGNLGAGRIATALLRLAFALPELRGERVVICGAEDGDGRMRAHLERLHGTPIRAQFYAVPVNQEGVCRQQ